MIRWLRNLFQPPPRPQTRVQAPKLLLTLKDRGDEAWLGSPAVADLDGDGKNEIIVARGERLVVWSADGSVKWFFDVEGRIWSSPVVADWAQSDIFFRSARLCGADALLLSNTPWL